MNEIHARPTKRETIQAIYDAVDAPSWAALNLDALADVLRDLSWLEPGPLMLRWHVSPDLPTTDLDGIHDVLIAAVAQSARSEHPLTLTISTST